MVAEGDYFSRHSDMTGVQGYWSLTYQDMSFLICIMAVSGLPADKSREEYTHGELLFAQLYAPKC